MADASVDLLISQWQGSPRLRGLLQVFLDELDAQLDALQLQWGLAVDIRQARGVFLDALGLRLGLARPFSTIGEDAGWGFDNAGDPFGEPFFSAEYETAYPLADAAYRSMVLARRDTDFGAGAAYDLQRAVRAIAPTADVTDNRDMTMTVLSAADETEYLKLADRLHALPRAAGVSVTYTSTTIAAVTGLTATATGTTVTLSWTDPANPALTAYQYRWQATGDTAYGSWATISGSSATTTTTTVTGLAAGKQYTWQVRGLVGTLEGPAGASVAVTLLPAAPTGLALDITGTTATLTWTDPGLASLTGYQTRRKAGSGSYGSWTTISGSSATTTSYSDTGLTAGTAYAYQLRAINSAGNGAASAAVSGNTIPAAPTGLSATTTATTIALSWTDPSDSTITGYAYRLGTGVWTAISGATATTVAHTISSLAEGTAYSVTLRASNSAGASAASTAVSATTGTNPPAQTTGLLASVSGTTLSLTWDDPSDSTITGYQYRTKAGTAAYGSWATITGSGASTTSTDITGLSNSTIYSVQVRAVNGGGNGTASTAVTGLLTVPATPTGLSGSTTTTSVTLTWTDPSDSTITGYAYRYRESGGNYGSWTTVSGAVTTVTISTGLTEGTTYDWQIRATNATGDSGATTAVSTTLGVTLPAAPTGLTATATGVSIALSWTDPSDSSITSYEIRTKAGTAAYGSWATISGSTATTTSHTLSSLSSGTLYTAQIRAVNSGGEGPASTAVTANTRPAALTGVSATATGTTVTLSWTDPTDTSITGYKYNQKAGTANFAGWTTIAGNDGSVNSTTFSVLTAGTTYVYRVRAVNAAGDGLVSSDATVTIGTAPSQVSGLAASASGTTVTLTWTDPSDSTITGFEYQQKAGSGSYGSWNAISGSTATTTTTSISGLTAGTTYAYKVRAVNAIGNGTASAEATVTLASTSSVPVAPANLYITLNGPGKNITLTWDDPGDSSITGYEYRTLSVGTDSAFGSWTAISGSSSSTTTHTITDGAASAADSEMVQLRAVGSGGNGAASPTVMGIRPNTTARAANRLTLITGNWDGKWEDNQVQSGSANTGPSSGAQWNIGTDASPATAATTVTQTENNGIAVMAGSHVTAFLAGSGRHIGLWHCIQGAFDDGTSSDLEGLRIEGRASGTDSWTEIQRLPGWAYVSPRAEGTTVTDYAGDTFQTVFSGSWRETVIAIPDGYTQIRFRPRIIVSGSNLSLHDIAIHQFWLRWTDSS